MKTLESTHILARIIKAKRRRVEDSRIRVPEAIVRNMASVAPRPISFHDAIGATGARRIIAEVKKASPSGGVLAEELDVEALARAYAGAGAAAISVVTEQDFFRGNLGWVKKAGEASRLPVLRKDFVFDRYQIFETRAAGASAVLLIVAMLRTEELKALLASAGEVGLDAVVEVHDEAELEEALEAGATIVGVNNRNLKTFDVSLETSARLGKMIPAGVLFVAESGIHSRKDIDFLTEAGADAFLIGEHFVTSPDPATTLRGLL